MSQFIKLTALELRRAMPFYLICIGLFVGVQLCLVALYSFFFQGAYPFNPLEVLKRELSVYTIVGCLLTGMFYCTWTWAKEWNSSHPFIYRLLLLPGARTTVYFAKFVSILIMLFGVVAVELAIVYVVQTYASAVTGSLYLFSNPIAVMASELSVWSGMISTNWVEFLSYYGYVCAMICFLFHVSILRRSLSRYRSFVPYVVGFVYVVACFILHIWFFGWLNSNEFLNSERTFLMFGGLVIYIVVHMIWSNWLLKHRLSV